MSLVISGATLPTPEIGEVGYTLKDADGDTIAPRSTAGIVQVFAGAGYGIYQAAIEVEEPEFSNMAAIVWDDGAGNAKASFRGMVAGPPQGSYTRPSKLFATSGAKTFFEAGT